MKGGLQGKGELGKRVWVLVSRSGKVEAELGQLLMLGGFKSSLFMCYLFMWINY